MESGNQGKDEDVNGIISISGSDHIGAMLTVVVVCSPTSVATQLSVGRLVLAGWLEALEKKFDLSVRKRVALLPHCTSLQCASRGGRHEER